MSKPARDTVRSFLPERYLISHRSVDALWLKYRFGQVGGVLVRLSQLFSPSVETSAYPNDISKYEPLKQLGSLLVEAGEPIPAGGHSGDYHIRMGDKNLIQLHLKSHGLMRGREDLRTAAGYIHRHPQLSSLPHVAGVTYGELADLLVKHLHFMEMPISELDLDYQQNLRAEHEVFCALNDLRRGQPFRSAMVFLPTEQFVAAFGSPPTAIPS